VRLTVKDRLWMKKFNWRPQVATEDIGWTEVTTYGVIRVPISALRATIVTSEGRERRKIADTPHFRWIVSLVNGREDLVARQDYHRYVASFFPDLDADGAVANVINLVASIKASAYADGALSVITGKPKRRYGFGPYFLKIFDGVHRSSCALALGHQYIQCRVK